MSHKNQSLSISNPQNIPIGAFGKLGIVFIILGMLSLICSFLNLIIVSNKITLAVTIISLVVGTILYSYNIYYKSSAGIKNNHIWSNSLTNRGVLGWITAIVLTTFYVLLYWWPEILGYQSGIDNTNTGLISLFDPLSQFFKSQNASQWFVYGTLYTLVIFALGFKFIFKYRSNNYQIIRTLSLIVCQIGFAYLIPEILAGLNYNDSVDAKGNYLGWYDTDIKNVWPLDYDFFHRWHLEAMQNEAYQPLGMILLVWGILLFLVVTPILTYFYGKRWYCSWVCGCGGLAETAGDPFRQLSSKTLNSWKIERWLIHSILIIVFIMTGVTLYGYFFDTGTIWGISIYNYFQKPYGFIIGACFSGVVGVGFYPLLGNRVWCRFGCPMAAYMGIFQRFKSRFRITTNGGQCISCGNCSTYCEQGIDVRAYAQKQENIVRASCVGCGICATVCPRGVLKLENGPEKTRLKSNLNSVESINLVALAKNKE